MKINGTILETGTIEWRADIQRYMFRGFTFEASAEALAVTPYPAPLVQLQGDDRRIFGFENCTFINGSVG